MWASSVDGLPIRDSARILVSHVTDAKNTGARFDAAGTLSFVARTDFDPASATLCYELARD